MLIGQQQPPHIANLAPKVQFMSLRSRMGRDQIQRAKAVQYATRFLQFAPYAFLPYHNPVLLSALQITEENENHLSERRTL